MPNNEFSDEQVPDIPEGEPRPAWIDTPEVLQLIRNIVHGWWARNPKNYLTTRIEEGDLFGAVYKRLRSREPWRTWNPEKTPSWRIYLIAHIRLVITNEVRRYRGTTGNPELTEQAVQMYAKRAELEEQLGRQPTVGELANSAGYSTKKVLRLMAANDTHAAQSFDTTDTADRSNRDADVAPAFDPNQPAAQERFLSVEFGYLDPEDLEILIRSVIHGERGKVLAEQYGVSEATMSRRLRRIRNQVKEQHFVNDP